MALRFLSSGISGLRANQTALDVIGNNIANLNTPGFKASRTVFADLLSQTTAGAQAASATSGGKGAMQVGLGVQLAAIQPMFTQGAVLATDNPTDLAIQGNGFFVLADGSNRYYSRTGAFRLDGSGHLVDSATGFRVQSSSGDITIASGTTTPASATTTAMFSGNLDASQPDGATYAMTTLIVDSLGKSHSLTLTFTKDFAGGPGQWDWAVTEADADIASLAGGTGTLDFNDSGVITAGATPTVTLTYAVAAGVTTPQALDFDFGSTANAGPMTGYSAASTAAFSSQDGFAAGALTTFGIGSDGSITGSFDNGVTTTIGNLALANFANSAGLMREGQNLWSESVDSGTPALGTPGTGGRGTILPCALEGSNVDLAREFTELITAQRGFEASARIIRVGDEILQTVVNIKQ